MPLEPYDPAAHYDLIAGWWRAHDDSVCLPADVLPPTGVVVLEGGSPIAASFLYLTNANAAHLAFTVTAPGLRPMRAVRAARQAIAGAIVLGRRCGAKMIWSTTDNAVIDRLAVREGFRRATPHHNHFLLLDSTLSSDLLGKDET